MILKSLIPQPGGVLMTHNVWRSQVRVHEVNGSATNGAEVAAAKFSSRSDSAVRALGARLVE
jgi:hypothetical protein